MEGGGGEWKRVVSKESTNSDLAGSIAQGLRSQKLEPDDMGSNVWP